MKLDPDLEKHYKEVLTACGENVNSLLDVGCGSGAFLRFATARNSSLRLPVGIENRASALAPSADGSTSPSPVVSDGQGLPLPEHCFDAVVSIDALEWNPDPIAFLKESARVCKPGGPVVAVHTDWDSVVYSASNETLSRHVLRTFCDSGPAGWMGRRLPTLFRAAGFADVGWTVGVIANQRFAPGQYGHHLAGAIADWATKHGDPDPKDIQRWRADLAELDSCGEYVFSVNRYICRNASGLSSGREDKTGAD